MITQRGQRIALIILEAFLAATTVAGGLGLIFGWIPLPLEWLNGSPFSSYTIPGLVLMVVVGGSALAAMVAVLRRHELGTAISVVAGLMMMGFETVEVLVVGSQLGLMRSLQVFYFTCGLLTIGVATWPWTPQHVASLRHTWHRP